MPRRCALATRQNWQMRSSVPFARVVPSGLPQAPLLPVVSPQGAKLPVSLGVCTVAFPAVNRRVIYFLYLHFRLKSGNEECASEPQRETHLCNSCVVRVSRASVRLLPSESHLPGRTHLMSEPMRLPTLFIPPRSGSAATHIMSRESHSSLRQAWLGFLVLNPFYRQKTSRLKYLVRT